ncbi:trypsin-like peptidase domain-containing protein [soil metagenome]
MINDETRINSDEPTEAVVKVAPTQPPRRPSSLMALLVGLVLLLGGVGLGWFLSEDDEPSAATTQPTIAQAAEATTPTVEATEEPVAAVAEALLPSMVHISTGSGLGSGFVYEDGYVLTAAHVVEGSNSVSVRFANGSQSEGTVVGTDPAHDIAVVSVDTEGIPVAQLALDVELQVGQLAVALGSPWGLDQTVTSGVVSAVNRPVLDFNSAQVLIQTDAPINPGNSGGALADRDGRVIGVNIEIITVTGSNSGVGFAVPISNAYEFASNIVAGTPIETAYLGVTGDDATGAQSGAVITELVPGSAAGAAGLVVGDIVTAVDTLAVFSISDLAARVRSYLPGDEVILDVIRNGEAITVRVTLGTLPEG